MISDHDGLGCVCGTQSIGDRGQRFEVYCKDPLGVEHRCGWTDDPSCFVGAIKKHPTLHSPRVIDRAPGQRRKGGDAVKTRWSIPGLSQAVAILFLVLSSFHLCVERYDAAMGVSLLSIGFSALAFSYTGMNRRERKGGTDANAPRLDTWA